MKEYKYIIEGKLFDQNYNYEHGISKLASKLDISAEINQTKAGFTIIARGSKANLAKFEPQLFRKLVTFFSISKYTKKEPAAKEDKLKDVTENSKDGYCEKDIKLAAKLLRQSKVIAVKQDNGFHIICNASQIKAVQTLREIIKQPDVPLSVVFRSIQKARQQIMCTKKEKELIIDPRHPIVIAKLKNLHRLEKPKHSLSPEINTINQRIAISIKKSIFCKELFKLIDFPIVNIDAIDSTNAIVATKEDLIDAYGDNFSSIFDLNIEIENPQLRKILQIVYGKKQLIVPNKPINIAEPTFDIFSDEEQSYFEQDGYKTIQFKIYKILLNNKGLQEPRYTALSLLFSKLPIESALGLNLPFTSEEINNLYESWKNSENTIETNSLISLFDAIASLSGELHQKSFTTQSLQLAESYFKVCEEGLFDYNISQNTIEIDIVSSFLDNENPKYLFCSLTNTIVLIISEIVKEQNLNVSLCGELFHYRDLTELLIEELKEEEIKVYF